MEPMTWTKYTDVAEMVALKMGDTVTPQAAMHPSGDPNATYMDVYGNDHEIHVKKMIEDKGKSDEFKVVLPAPNEIQIDYDQMTIPEQFYDGLHFIGQAFIEVDQIIRYTTTRSKSGNLHVNVALPQSVVLTDVERVGWQAVFGSDKNREALSLVSIRRGLKNPSLMIEFKDEASSQPRHHIYRRTR
jgi:hypothetical protein